MSPTPDPSFDPEEIPYFFDNWCGLPWTPWVPFNADKRTFGMIPHEPGLYRIRPAGKDFLLYIGVTGRTLHKRMSDLRQSLRRADLMPWADPLPEAPALWAWWSDWLSNQDEEKNMKCSSTSDLLSSQDEEKKSQISSNSDRLSGQPDEMKPKVSSNSDWLSSQEEEEKSQISSTSDWSSGQEENEDQDAEALPEGAGPLMLECSAAPLDASAAGRRGMESFLLYRYRQERGESPLCNFGRFHPRYRKSTIRKEGLRGGKLAEDQKDNPAGFAGIGPLEVTGKPGDRDWMGLEWTVPEPLTVENVRGIPPGAGLYLLSDAASHEIVYIGQSADVADRLPGLIRRTWGDRLVEFSYQIIGLSVVPHNLRELENDLMGNYFEHFRKAPEFQFQNQTGSQEP